MARPRADMRQKYLIPTVFSNTRIGKLGKTRPWIFQTWAGLLSRTDSYGIFKWEPERIAILVWPYNSERQDTFSEDMDLLAEGSAEDRVIQKYEIDGVCYGCFPHFEEHNAMERRGAPTLPFPPGVKAPPPAPPPKRKKEMEKEIEGDLSRPRLTEVNSSSVRISPEVPPVQSVQQTTPPAPRECNHWPRCTADKGVCGKPAPTPKPHKLGFDPYDIEPFDDWTADEIRLVVCYWWEHAKNTWYRDNVNRPEYFREKFAKMAGEMPRNWQPPKPKETTVQKAKPKADPTCEKCHGKGEFKVDKPGYPKGMFLQRVVCPCTEAANV